MLFVKYPAHCAIKLLCRFKVKKPFAVGRVANDCSAFALLFKILYVALFKKELFAYFKPAIGNNKRFDVPLGLSVFANSVDTLESIDILFDSLQREFVFRQETYNRPQ